ncbi:MAG: hypothetical protein WCY29_02145 [Novosphingobium sp.]
MTAGANCLYGAAIEDLSRYQMPATSLDELRAIGELRRNRQGG